MIEPGPSRANVAALVGAVVIAATSPSWASDAKVDSCASASEAGQRAVAARHFDEARRHLLVCTQSACPPPIRRDCDQLLSQVELDSPSVVIHLRDAEGHDVDSAAVTIDGQPTAHALAGGALTLDPGPHVIRITRGVDVAQQSVVLREREKDRAVALQFAQAHRDSPTVPFAVYPLAGIGLAGLAVFAVLAVSGQSAYDACQSQGCDDARRSRLETQRWVTWTALGGGLASLAAATIILFGARGHDVSLGASAQGAGAELSLQCRF
jgi:hypothetical protein